MAAPPVQGSDQYFTASPGVASRPRTVQVLLPDVDFEAVTDRGVFAGDGLDTGTRLLLLDGPPPRPDARHLLDLGCGWGPIALTLARRHPDATVWAVDVNERAVELCRRNAADQGLTNVEVHQVPADDPTAGIPAEVELDAIWSNPPIRIGKEALHGLLLSALARLAPEGSAHLVVQRHLGADSLQRWLDEQGHPCTRRGARAGFRLLDVAARVDRPETDDPTGDAAAADLPAGAPVPEDRDEPEPDDPSGGVAPATVAPIDGAPS